MHPGLSREPGNASWLVEKAWECIMICYESLEMHPGLSGKPRNASRLIEKAWKCIGSIREKWDSIQAFLESLE